MSHIFPKESHPASGLLTGTVTTLLDGSGEKEYTVYYYDEKGRPEKTVSSNHLGGYDTTTTVYTFTGKPKTVTHASARARPNKHKYILIPTTMPTV
ncbi:MAG: hypothetical protein V8Q76_06940 [Bacteroides intestinalis]